MLIINRYTCPINKIITIQAHVIKDGLLVKSYPKMVTSDFSLFTSYDLIVVCEVVRSKNLKDVNIIKKGVKND